MDVRGLDTGTLELIPVRAHKVHVMASARAQAEPAFDLPLFVPGIAERRHNVLSDLPAAHAQTRSDSGDEIRRRRAELPLHGGNGPRDSAAARTSPTCMHGPDDAEAAVGEKDRRAVGDPDDDGRVPIVADDDVRLRGRLLRRASPPHNRDRGFMHLPDQPKRLGRDAHRSGNGLPLRRVVS